MNPAAVGALELLMTLSVSKVITPAFKRSARISAVTRSLQTNIGWGPLDYQVDQMISVIMTLMTMGIVGAMVRTIMAQSTEGQIDPDIYGSKFYHGTNSIAANHILREGLRCKEGPVWLTTSYRDAHDMSIETSIRSGGKPVVLTVALPKEWPLESAETEGYVTWKEIPARYVHRSTTMAQSAEDQIVYYINTGTTMTVSKVPSGVRTVVRVSPQDSLWGRYEEKEFYGKDVNVSVNAAIDWMHKVMIGKIRAVGRKLVIEEKPSKN